MGRKFHNKKIVRNRKHKERNYTQAGPVTVTNAKGESWEMPAYDIVQLARVNAGARLRNQRITADQRSKVFKRDRGRCRYCYQFVGPNGAAYEIDHVVPRAKGGLTEMANLVLACRACNRAKSDAIWKPRAIYRKT